MSAAALLALFAEKRTTPFLRQTEDWIVVGLLSGALLAGAVILHYFERWRKGAISGPAHDPSHDLTDYRGMFERGEITQAEYETLRLKVAERAKPLPPPVPLQPAPEAPPEPSGERTPPA